MGYEFIEDSRVAVMVYDVSISDINERKEKAVKYATLKLAEQKLGIGYNAIKNAANKRIRIYSPHLDREVAIRYVR
jgi:hypothetical protein